MTIKDPARHRAAYTWHNRLREKRLADVALEEAQLLLGPGARCVAYYQVYGGRPPGKDYELAAQQRVVMRLVANAGATLIGGPYEQLERPRWYRQAERPQLVAALAYCRAQDATLIIAKLGHQAASAPLLSQLAASGVRFVTGDRKDVNHVTIQGLAIAAQKARTAKVEKLRKLHASGAFPQRPVVTPESMKRAVEARRQQARDFAVKIAPLMEAGRRGGLTLRQLAAELNAIGQKTRHGLKWNRQTVGRALRFHRRLPLNETQIAVAANLMAARATERVESSSAATTAPPAQGASPDFRTGLPGRSSGFGVIEAEARRRYAEGEHHKNATGLESPKGWALRLLPWYESQYASGPRIGQGALQNRLRVVLRELQGRKT